MTGHLGRVWEMIQHHTESKTFLFSFNIPCTTHLFYGFEVSRESFNLGPHYSPSALLGWQRHRTFGQSRSANDTLLLVSPGVYYFNPFVVFGKRNCTQKRLMIFCAVPRHFPSNAKREGYFPGN